MTTTTTAVETVDLDAIERDTQEQVERLRERRQTLSLDALTDPATAAELAEVETELRSAENALSHIELARTETARRERETLDRQAQLARDEALDKARELQVERERAAARFDAAAAKLASALADLYRIAGEQSNALLAAGARPHGSAQFRAGAAQEALKHYLHEAGVAGNPLDSPPGACQAR